MPALEDFSEEVKQPLGTRAKEVEQFVGNARDLLEQAGKGRLV